MTLAISIFGLLIFSCVENSKKEEKEIKAENIMTELKKYNLPEYFKKLQEKELLFLKENVFYGLPSGIPNKKNQYYFSKTDFEIVLSRVENLNIGIDFIDIYKNGKIVSSEFPEDYHLKSNDPKWYKSSFKKRSNNATDLRFNAVFGLPDDLLDKILNN